MKRDKSEKIQFPTGLQDGDRDLGDLREETLRVDIERRRPLHHLTIAAIAFGHERELEGTEERVGAIGIADKEGGEERITREGHECSSNPFIIAKNGCFVNHSLLILGIFSGSPPARE